MNVDRKIYLYSIKTKDATATAATVTATVTATAAFKEERRKRLLCREASNLSNSSMEAGGGEYHAQEPAAVPFVWESSPGTPKRYMNVRSSYGHHHEVDEHLLPPLTPPPSYQYYNNCGATRKRSSSKKKKQNDANVNLIQSIFPRLSITKKPPPIALSSPYPSLSSSSSTKSSSLSSSPSSQSRSMVSTPTSLLRHKLSFDSKVQAFEEEEVGSSSSPVSTLCFGRLSCCNSRIRGL